MSNFNYYKATIQDTSGAEHEVYLPDAPIEVMSGGGGGGGTVDKTLSMPDTAADAKAVGEEINGLKDDLSDLDSRLSESITEIQSNLSIKIKSDYINKFHGDSETIDSISYNEQNDLVWTFNRKTAHVGSYARIDYASVFKNKKYKVNVYNPNNEQISITVHITCSGGNWNAPAYAYKVGTLANIAHDNIASIDVDGSKYSKITNQAEFAFITFEVVSNYDLNKESSVWISISEIKASSDKLGSAVNAQTAVIAQTAVTAQTAAIAQTAVTAQIAASAGYVDGIAGNDAKVLYRNIKKSNNEALPNALTLEVNEKNEFVFTWVSPNNDYVNQTESNIQWWSYSVASVPINQWVGIGAKIKVEVDIPDYSGNVSTSLNFNHLFISKSAGSWAGTNMYKNFTGTGLGAGLKTSYTIDIDKSIPETADFNKAIYLCIGTEVNNTFAPNAHPTFTWNDTTAYVKFIVTFADSRVVATEFADFEPRNYYTKSEIDSKFSLTGNYITCWGDSLTAGGGWNSRLAELAGMTMYNGGTGGENARTIVARQGADVMMIDGITIPATTEPVTIATRAGDTGIATYEGYKVTPLLQGGAHVNPVKIGDIEGTLRWTGSNHSDTTGIWTFTRSTAGSEFVIDRPTAIRTEFDRNKNAPYLMVIFIGQNGGYTDIDDLIRKHRLMIEHAHAKNFIVLGLSSGTSADRKAYEDAMKKEFGRYFISLREYLAHPIYQDGEIVSCYGLADQNLTPDPSYSYNGKTTLQEIAEGTVPHQILADGVHYTAGTKTVIGNMLYKKCCELGIF